MVFRLLLLLGLSAGFFRAHAQADVDACAADVARSLYRALKDSPATVPAHAKIAVVPFLLRDAVSDTVRTRLGVMLAEQTAHALQQLAGEKKAGWHVLFPEGTGARLEGEMYRYFTPPANTDENAYWAQLVANQSPDVFVTASLYWEDDVLRVERIQCRTNIYRDAATGSTGKTLPADAVRYKPISPATLKGFSAPFAPPMSQVYQDLKHWEGAVTNLILQMGVTDSTGQKPIKTMGLKRRTGYQLAVELQQPCYLYVFYYEPSSIDVPYFQPLHPYLPQQLGQRVPAGRSLFPEDATFELTPQSQGQVYLQVIAAQQPLPFKLESVGEYPILSQSQAQTLLEYLRKNPGSAQTQSLVFSIEQSSL